MKEAFMKSVILMDKKKRRYIFTDAGNVYIDNVYQGKGALDIKTARLLNDAEFTLNNKAWKTASLIGAIIKEEDVF